MKDKQYSQSLNIKQAAEGIKVAIENSQDLLSDALLLFENGRYPRAVALAILAIEEAAKPSIIRSIILENEPSQYKKEWQRFRGHTSKNASWILPQLISKGATRAEEMKQIFDPNSQHTREIDNLKQLAFYTDAYSSCKWSAPKATVSKELAVSIIKIAKGMVSNTHSIVTEQELKLWVKHLKPVWKVGDMKQALLKCYEEAEQLGMLRKGTFKRMKDFMS